MNACLIFFVLKSLPSLKFLLDISQPLFSIMEILGKKNALWLAMIMRRALWKILEK
jgi:hypothetical protein